VPVIEISKMQQEIFQRWPAIANQVLNYLNSNDKSNGVIAIECYHGVADSLIVEQLQRYLPGIYTYSVDSFKTESEIQQIIYPDVTDDEVFGFITRLTINDYFDKNKLAAARRQTELLKDQEQLVIVYGTGASLIYPNADCIVFLDMARWEIQQRFRRDEISNLGLNNPQTQTSLQYKQAFFVDWRVCDKHKKELFEKINYIVDVNATAEPKMLKFDTYRKALELAVTRPFRVVPLFDPGTWGGQWMKEYCDLDRTAVNYAWGFDCVPEENSLLLQFGNINFETPCINLVFLESRKLLGQVVQARFGDEFPIRFDFLDTMDGGNLSLQVHPTTEYIQEKFGMHYTQDESYYILDAEPDAAVYLGTKNGTKPEEMILALQNAQTEGSVFETEKYINKWPVKKHDHILIPAGTIHCSGANNLILEISATPFIFTFKLYDWGRLGLDGRPRPINIKHGEAVIDWSRETDFVKKELINTFSTIETGDGWTETKTGLHKREFIETRVHEFSVKIIHHTNDSVNVLNLVEGREAIVESPDNCFEPYVIHYAETFIIPEAVKTYSIRPYGESEGHTCKTIKAFIRTHA